MKHITTPFRRSVAWQFEPPSVEGVDAEEVFSLTSQQLHLAIVNEIDHTSWIHGTTTVVQKVSDRVGSLVERGVQIPYAGERFFDCANEFIGVFHRNLFSWMWW
jgi:hypothetical protein